MGVSKNEMEMYQEGAISNTYICVAHPCTRSLDLTIQTVHDRDKPGLDEYAKGILLQDRFKLG